MYLRLEDVATVGIAFNKYMYCVVRRAVLMARSELSSEPKVRSPLMKEAHRVLDRQVVPCFVSR